jgi:hypothetical protein
MIQLVKIFYQCIKRFWIENIVLTLTNQMNLSRHKIKKKKNMWGLAEYGSIFQTDLVSGLS